MLDKEHDGTFLEHGMYSLPGTLLVHLTGLQEKPRPAHVQLPPASNHGHSRDTIKKWQREPGQIYPQLCAQQKTKKEVLNKLPETNVQLYSHNVCE